MMASMLRDASQNPITATAPSSTPAACFTTSIMPTSTLECLAFELKEQVFKSLIPESPGAHIFIENIFATTTLKDVLPLALACKTLRNDVLSYLFERETVVLDLYFYGRPYALPAPGIPELHLNLVKHINLDARQLPFLAPVLDISKATFPSLEKLVIVWPNTQSYPGDDEMTTNVYARFAAVSAVQAVFLFSCLNPIVFWLQNIIEDVSRGFSVHHKVTVAIMHYFGFSAQQIGEVRCLLESIGGEENRSVLDSAVDWPTKVVSLKEAAEFLHFK